MNAKGVVTVLWLCCMVHLTYAQKPNNEWKETPNRLTLSGSLLAYGSEPGYDLTISYTRFLSRFLGVTTDIGFRSWFMDSYKPQSEVTDRNGKAYQLDHDDSTLKNLNIQVGPVFSLPVLTFGKDKDMSIRWECHPAIAFTLPNATFSYVHTELDKGRWVKYEKRIRNRGVQTKRNAEIEREKVNFLNVFFIFAEL